MVCMGLKVEDIKPFIIKKEAIECQWLWQIMLYKNGTIF